MDRIIQQNLSDSITAKERVASSHLEEIKELARWIATAIDSGGKLLIFGNGGSAADAQHMAAEFVNRFLIDRRPLPAIALTTDSSILTSIGNDFSFDQIFAKQVLALGHPGDVALGVSTSGNSPNVIKGIEAARERGMKTAVLTGKNGGSLRELADLAINVDHEKTPAIQEAHIWVEHLLCQLVDELLFGGLTGEMRP